MRPWVMAEDRPAPAAISLTDEIVHERHVSKEPPVKDPVRNLTWSGISALAYFVSIALLDSLYMNLDFFYEHLNEIRVIVWPVVFCTLFLVPWRIKSTLQDNSRREGKSTLRMAVSSVVVTLSGFLLMVVMLIFGFFLSLFF